MPKSPVEEAVSDERVFKALAEKAREVFGAQPSDENIRRISAEAKLYALMYRSRGTDRREADARVAKLVGNLRAALEQSAAHHQTFSIMLGSECERALAEVERIALSLAQKPGSGRPRNERLRPLCDVVLDAYWEVHKAKIGTVGISTKREDNSLYGPVLEVVQEALRLSGVTRMPSNGTILDAAQEACQAKVVSCGG